MSVGGFRNINSANSMLSFQMSFMGHSSELLIQEVSGFPNIHNYVTWGDEEC